MSYKNLYLSITFFILFPKGIMVLLDTLSDLDKLNQGEYSKYQLCSSKIDM